MSHCVFCLRKQLMYPKGFECLSLNQLMETPPLTEKCLEKKKKRKQQFFTFLFTDTNSYIFKISCAGLACWKNHFSGASPARWKNHPSFVGPLEKSFLMWWARLGTSFGPGPDLCRLLS